MTIGAQDPLEALFYAKQIELMQIKRRIHLLSAFLRDLREMTRGKRFHIWNDLLWMTLLDSRDMAFVQLADWGKAQLVGGGLFGLLKAHHVNAFRRQRPGADAELERELTAAYAGMFPNAGPVARPADIDEVKDRFAEIIGPVQEDRHRNRAHRYESEVRGVGEVAMLSIDDASRVFREVEELLNGLRAVARLPVVATDVVLAMTSPTVAAIDLVDDILLGHWNHVEPREAHYARLHNEHDTAGGGGLFNDNTHMLAIRRAE